MLSRKNNIYFLQCTNFHVSFQKLNSPVNIYIVYSFRPLVCCVIEVSPCQDTGLAIGKTGDRVAVLPPPDLRDNFSGYHPLDGLSAPRLLDPVQEGDGDNSFGLGTGQRTQSLIWKKTFTLFIKCVH
jgi:hypothetical protein